jgi:dihydroflavonol-4-reductase
MADSAQKVLVLGATGFIGGHIAQAALSVGWRVRALRRNPAMTGHLGAARVEWVDGNLDDFNSLVNAMQGRDTVFHAAGYYPSRGERRSLVEHVQYGRKQTERVISAAQQTGIRRLVYTSTLTTIGHPPATVMRLADENDFYQQGSLERSAYYETKVAMEQTMLAASKQGFPVVVLNPTAVFGPGDVHQTLGGILLAAARGWAIAWIDVTVNIVDVRDVALAHIRAAECGRPGDRYILGGHNLPLKDVLDRLARITGATPPRFNLPLWLIDGLVRLDDMLPFINLTGNHLRAVREWQGYNTTKARLELGFNPRPFEETVRDALEWFRENGDRKQ